MLAVHGNNCVFFSLLVFYFLFQVFSLSRELKFKAGKGQFHDAREGKDPCENSISKR